MGTRILIITSNFVLSDDIYLSLLTLPNNSFDIHPAQERFNWKCLPQVPSRYVLATSSEAAITAELDNPGTENAYYTYI